MIRQPVTSSQIASVGFDPTLKTLEIEFKGGSVYQYTGEGIEQKYNEMVNSPSIGSYFIRNIKNNKAFPYTKIG
jgi:KTSC domain